MAAPWGIGWESGGSRVGLVRRSLTGLLACGLLGLAALPATMGPALANGGAPGAAASTFVPPAAITVALDDGYAPYSFATGQGGIQGLMRDLWDLWSKKTGVNVVYAPVNRAHRTDLLDDGRADVAGHLMETDAREAKYLLTEAPVTGVEMAVFFDRDIAGIAGVDSLQGFTVGVMGDGSCAEFLAKHGITLLRHYPTLEALFAAAARGEVNVFCSSKAGGIRRLYSMHIEKQFAVSPTLFTTPLYWAVRRDAAPLRDFIRDGFTRITPAERAAIEQRWLGEPLASLWSDTAFRVLAWLLLAAGVGASVLFAWNTSLRRQVAAKTAGLTLSERRYRELIEAVPVGIFETDADGDAFYCNEVWTALSGLTMAQSAGDGWLAAVHPEDRAPLLAAWNAAWTLRRPFRHEHRLCRLDGTELWVAVAAVPRMDAAGALSGYIGSVTDVSEEKRHEEERRRLEWQSQESKKLEALGQFAGGIAHDFNNFLGAILGYAQFIVEDAGERPQAGSAARYAERILTAGRRGRALVEQILTFTRRTRMTRTRFHLSELLPEIEELMFASASGDAAFRCENADPDAVVEADRNQLAQVLLNLCINGQDALRGRPGTVTVRIRRTAFGPRVLQGLARSRSENEVSVWTEPDGTACAVAGSFDPALDHVSMVVSDTGLGMDAALLEQAFTPFFTTKDRATGGQGTGRQGTGRQGTGLGLAVVKGIVTAHGAALVVESHAGEGTAIEVAFPRVAVAVAGPEPAAEPAPRLHRRRILLVDDDADFCDMMRLLLERLGFEVVPYASPREALADFRELPQTFDAMITDQNMPEMTGLALAGAVRGLRPDFPCLVCSAYSESLTEAALREAGVFALIPKPVDRDLLLATLQRVLGLAATARRAGALPAE